MATTQYVPTKKKQAKVSVWVLEGGRSELPGSLKQHHRVFTLVGLG